jgi:hypothetical protein
VDIVDFSTTLATIHITDLNTLDYLLHQERRLQFNVVTMSQYLAVATPLLQNLSLILRPPLANLKHLTDSSNASSSNTMAAWPEVCVAIVDLQKLVNFRPWPDHDDQSWSIVYERFLLAPLEALADVPAAKMLVSLLKLHPLHEHPRYHYMEDSPLPPFTIQRRLRQRYYIDKPSLYRILAYYRPDFPILDPDPNGYEDADELEDMERAMWKNGEDVEREVCNPTRFQRVPSQVIAPADISSTRWIGSSMRSSGGFEYQKCHSIRHQIPQMARSLNPMRKMTRTQMHRSNRPQLGTRYQQVGWPDFVEPDGRDTFGFLRVRKRAWGCSQCPTIIAEENRVN